RVHVLERTLERGCIEHVPADDLDAGGHAGRDLLGAAGETSDSLAAFVECSDEPTANVAAGAGDEDEARADGRRRWRRRGRRRGLLVRYHWLTRHAAFLSIGWFAVASASRRSRRLAPTRIPSCRRSFSISATPAPPTMMEMDGGIRARRVLSSPSVRPGSWT